MTRNPIEFLAQGRVKEFINRFVHDSRGAFVNSDAKIFHSGEFGSYRERIVKELIADFTPRYMAQGEGFVCNKSDKNSTQCDIVIFDRNETPEIETDDLRRFFPVETLYGVGEVKSNPTVGELAESLDKLSRVKELRWDEPSDPNPVRSINVDMHDERRYFTIPEKDRDMEKLTDLSNWDPENVEFQNIVTFLVCESIKFSGDSMLSLRDRFYSREIDREPLQHNFILSLKDGLLSYQTEHSDGKNVPYHFPRNGVARAGYRFVKPNAEGNHVIAFLSGLVSALSQTCIYQFDIQDYVQLPDEQRVPFG